MVKCRRLPQQCSLWSMGHPWPHIQRPIARARHGLAFSDPLLQRTAVPALAPVDDSWRGQNPHRGPCVYGATGYAQQVRNLLDLQ